MSALLFQLWCTSTTSLLRVLRKTARSLPKHSVTNAATLNRVLRRLRLRVLAQIVGSCTLTCVAEIGIRENGVPFVCESLPGGADSSAFAYEIWKLNFAGHHT